MGVVDRFGRAMLFVCNIRISTRSEYYDGIFLILVYFLY
jgi:hypothetical protein